MLFNEDCQFYWLDYDVDCCGIPHFHREVAQMLWIMIVTGCLIAASAVIAVVYGDD